MTQDLIIGLETLEMYEEEINAKFEVVVEDDWAVVRNVELNEEQTYQYEECTITPDELIEEMVY